MKNDYLIRKEARLKEERVTKIIFVALLSAVFVVIVMFAINLLMF
jgi:hypothetical protein